MTLSVHILQTKTKCSRPNKRCCISLIKEAENIRICETSQVVSCLGIKQQIRQVMSYNLSPNDHDRHVCYLPATADKTTSQTQPQTFGCTTNC